MATNKHSKEGAEFISDLKLNPDDYPEIIERLSKKTMRYYLSLFNSKYDDKMMLWKIVDLLSFNKQMLAYLCEDLQNKGYHKEAKVIAVQH